MGTWCRKNCTRPKIPGKNTCEYHYNQYKEWRSQYRERENARVRQKRFDARMKVISELGGKCSVCGHDNPLHLVVHHVDGGGNVDRKKDKMGGERKVVYVRDGIPGGLSLMCANCHMEHHYSDAAPRP